LLNNLRIDEAIVYKDPNFLAKLKSSCPKGIDCYFDNVGEEFLDEVLKLSNHNARIALCGAITNYTDYENRKGIKNYTLMINKRIKMQGLTFM